MLDRGLSPRTVQYTHAVLNRALKQAERWGLLPRNVCEDVDQPRLQREEMQPLDRAQARRLLKAAKVDRVEALYVLAIHTGMRPGELLGLKWTSTSPAEAFGSTVRSPTASSPRQKRREVAGG
jgi:integrase